MKLFLSVVLLVACAAAQSVVEREKPESARWWPTWFGEGAAESDEETPTPDVAPCVFLYGRGLTLEEARPYFPADDPHIHGTHYRTPAHDFSMYTSITPRTGREREPANCTALDGCRFCRPA
jgi:hypothetical protein